MAALIVRWNGNIDKLGWGVGIAQTDDRDVDIGSFFDGLSVGSGISDDYQSRFLERAGDVICEISWSEATSNCDRAGMSSKLQDSSLAVRTSGDDTDIGWVVYGNDNAGGENDLLPVLKFLSVRARRQTVLSLRCEI